MTDTTELSTDAGSALEEVGTAGSGLLRHPLWFPASRARLAGGLVVAVAGCAAAAPLASTLTLHRFPGIGFLLVVLIATLVGRLASGLVAAVLSGVLLDVVVIPPTDAFSRPKGPELPGLLIFLGASVAVAWIVTSREAAKARAETLALENADLLELERVARDDAEGTRDRLGLVSRVSELLALSMDYPGTYTRLAELVVGRLASLCLIDVIDESGQITRQAAVHQDPAKHAIVSRLMDFPPSLDGTHPVARVLRGGTAEYSPEIPPDFLRDTTRDEEHLRIVRELGFQSFMCLPLATRGRILGTLTLVSTDPVRRFGQDDLTTAAEIARRAAVRIDNARLYQQRDHIARTLQEVLLPRSLPKIAGFEMSAGYWPAREGLEVGGDFYDAFRRPDGSVGLVIGDVCGKGAEAAAVMGVARQAVRVAGMSESRPSAILEVVNRSLLLGDFADRFVTACDVRLRPREDGGMMTACSAGHPFPLVVRVDGSVKAIGEPGNFLGVFEDVKLTDVAESIEPGDLLVLYTDGLVEWPHAPDAEGRFTALLSDHAGRSAPEVVAAAGEWWRTGVGSAARDDAALLVVRSLPGSPAPPGAAAR
ncbi:MAG TPA: SpoIIE family protein phosphatase [Actinomycetota bacterium]|nr:SpoIIE family protein phosphatase [Actinomycetota bacterium]